MAAQQISPASRYIRHERAGKGSFGAVYRGTDIRNGSPVALKIINLDGYAFDVESILGELAVLSRCHHNNVVGFHTSFIEPAPPRLWIVMDYCGGGSVRQLMHGGSLDEKFIGVIAREVLHGLTYLHQNGLIHRDIKAANVLLTDLGEVKLCDFGVAGTLSSARSTRRMSFVGTPAWMAPEVITHDRYDQKADVWSFGILLYEMATGDAPTANLDPIAALQAIPHLPPARLDSDYSKGLREIVRACLQTAPEKRPTAAHLLKFSFIKTAKKSVHVLRMLLVEYEKYLADHPSEDEVSYDSDSEEESQQQRVEASSSRLARRVSRRGNTPLWDFDIDMHDDDHHTDRLDISTSLPPLLENPLTSPHEKRRRSSMDVITQYPTRRKGSVESAAPPVTSVGRRRSMDSLASGNSLVRRGSQDSVSSTSSLANHPLRRPRGESVSSDTARRSSILSTTTDSEESVESPVSVTTASLGSNASLEEIISLGGSPQSDTKQEQMEPPSPSVQQKDAFIKQKERKELEAKEKETREAKEKDTKEKEVATEAKAMDQSPPASSRSRDSSPPSFGPAEPSQLSPGTPVRVLQLSPRAASADPLASPDTSSPSDLLRRRNTPSIHISFPAAEPMPLSPLLATGAARSPTSPKRPPTPPLSPSSANATAGSPTDSSASAAARAAMLEARARRRLSGPPALSIISEESEGALHAASVTPAPLSGRRPPDYLSPLSPGEKPPSPQFSRARNTSEPSPPMRASLMRISPLAAKRFDADEADATPSASRTAPTATALSPTTTTPPLAVVARRMQNGALGPVAGVAQGPSMVPSEQTREARNAARDAVVASSQNLLALLTGVESTLQQVDIPATVKSTKSL